MKTKNQSIVTALALGLLTVAAVMLCLNAQSSLASPAQGDVITVCLDGDCDHNTIQAAVDAAQDGDTIKVAAGTYSGVQSRPAPAGYPEGTVVTQVVYLAKSVTVQGGYTVTDWTTPDPEANPTTLDAEGKGRGLFIAGPAAHPTLVGLRVTGGDASALRGHPGFPDTDAAGGVYVFSSTATITGSQVFGNAADWGGGLYLYQSEATLSDNAVFSNTAFRFFSPGAFYGGGLYLYESGAMLMGNSVYSNTANAGGGLYLERSPAVLTGNVVISNTAEWYGGGLRLEYSDGAKLSDNTVHGNTAHGGGGLYLYYSNAELDGNTITGNVANQSHGGGLYLQRSDAVLTGNLIISNTAESYGGGLHLYLRSEATLVNNVVADNRAGVSGGGLYVWNSAPDLLHTTIARNGSARLATGESGDGSGVYVQNASQPFLSVSLTNTIIVSHSVGISVAAGGIVAVNGVLWDSDTITPVSRSPLTTTVTLRNQHVGDPAFAPDGYHLLPESDAIDRGVDAGVDVDIDGEPRPRQSGYDLGADEAGPVLFASFTHSGPDWLGQQTVFTNTTVASEPVSYRWDFGDGAFSTAVSPTHAYTAPGGYTVVLTATSGELESVATGRVVIYAASFTSSSPDWLGQTTVFTNTTQATDETDYRWSFGDELTSTLENPTHVYDAPGVYTVVLTATNVEGSGVATGTVTIYSGPEAGFISSSPDWLGQTTFFTNTTTTAPPGDPTVTYEWGFGDGVTSALTSPSHTYASPGLYTVLLTATNAVSSDVATDTVTIYGAPTVDFTASPTEGVAPLGVTFTATVTTTPPGDPTLAYVWRFDDGGMSTMRNPMYTYGTAGVYTVTLGVSNAAGSDVEIKERYITVREGEVYYLPLVLRSHWGVATGHAGER